MRPPKPLAIMEQHGDWVAFLKGTSPFHSCFKCPLILYKGCKEPQRDMALTSCVTAQVAARNLSYTNESKKRERVPEEEVGWVANHVCQRIPAKRKEAEHMR